MADDTQSPLAEAGGSGHEPLAASPLVSYWQTAPESRVVEEQYRLLPSDLRRSTWRVRIMRVSYQGIERLRLVLHFDRTHKPLALNQQQCQQIIRSTGSGDPQDWIGRSVELCVEEVDAVPMIRIQPVPEERLPSPGSAERDDATPPIAKATKLLDNAADAPRAQSYGTTILLLVILALLLGLVFIIENADVVWPWWGG